MKSLIISVVLIVVLGTNAFAQNKIEKIEVFLSTLAANQGLNGNVLVAEKGKVIYEKSYGYADFAAKRLNTPETVFPIASITKTLTSTAILQEVAKGKIRLDAAAADYLPGFPYPGITVRHLLSHTSGIPPYNAFCESRRKAEPNVIFTNADFMPVLMANPKPGIYAPGESWNYDNTNYIVLALILEAVSGESYREYIKKHILQPAGMKQTVFFPFLFDPSKNKIPNLAIPHWYPQMYADEPIRADSMEYVASYWKAYQFSGFGDFISTPHDLLKYDRALSDGTLLSPRLLEEAFVPVKLNNVKENPGNYGLGWTIGKDDSFGKVVSHVGGSIGLSCILYRNITRNQTVIAFDIARPSAAYIASSVMKILNSESVPLPRKNLVRIYGKILVTQGSEIAAETIERLRKDTVNYDLEKEDMIKLGYELMGDINTFRLPIEPRNKEAIEVFKMCVRLFPDYWNSYDSYADALARTGDTELAIKMYRKSIELNPGNKEGIKILEKLLADKDKRLH